MLRILLIALAGTGLVALILADWLEGRSYLPATVGAGIVLAGLLFENRRYKRVLDTAPGTGWQATGERFVDPDSGKLVAVFFNPATGERRYVDADA
ncbi:hypothetical protein [Novosphingobium sp. FSW06-99]|uniref:hypothetical protein n=1 Tax=Novosphingobium sp. FSW06-99 TaxID=1739113 RepID=UPI000AC6DE91|nr:hypothetical protein [Novosphingobium sp. FSW06-99]